MDQQTANWKKNKCASFFAESEQIITFFPSAAT